MESTTGNAFPADGAENSFLIRVARFIGTLERTPLSLPARQLLRRAPLREIRQFGSEQLPGSILDGEIDARLHAQIPPLESIVQLCLAAESLNNADTRQRHGAFFTPPPIAQRICNAFTLDPKHTFLDPAAGSGIFLIARFESLISSGLPSDTHILESARSIFGVERNELMCRMARTTLALAIWQHAPDLPWSELGLHQSIRTFDALSTPLMGQQSWQSEFGISSFDCIAGNPPFGISRDGGLTEDEKAAIREQLAPYLEGKINKYMAFIARGYELLSARGILSLITPNSWLGIASGRKLRKRLIQERALTRIERFTEPLFPGLGVEVDVVTIQKSSSRSSISVECYNNATEAAAAAGYELPFSLLTQLPDQILPVATPPAVLELALRLMSSGIPLGHSESPVVPAIALQAYALGKGSPPQTAEDVRQRPYDRTSAIDENTLPYLDGRDVTRFRVHWRGGYLRWGPWLAEPQNLDRFRGPRILVREVLGAAPYRIQTCYVEAPYLYNKSVLHLLRRADADRTSLQALTTILNSKIGSFLLSSLGRKAQRTLFPKLVLEDLNQFPFPSMSAQAARELAQCNDDSMYTTEGDRTRLDMLVYDVFRLSQREIATVEAYLSGGS